MRLALILLPALGLALAGCSSSLGGGSTAPSKTYIIMPNGQQTQCGPGTGTSCP
ncbi:hypothetical protein [Acidisoma sp. 7E03]